MTPTFYTASGDAVVGNPIQLQPAEIRFIPVEQLMPEYLRGQHRWGGIALSYTGNVLEVWAQITFHGIGGGSIDETFNILEEPGSDTREAVWLMPRKSTAMIALGNSSSTAIHTTAQFGGGASEDFEIPAGVTRFVRHHAREGGNGTASAESVKLTTVGPEGALRVAGFVVGDDNDFASSIRFYDTKKTVQPNLYAVSLRLKNATPRMVLKNTSDNEISARPRFFSSAGEQASYPWRVDNDYSTVVVVTNVGNEPARFQVEIRYPGGPYSIKQRELAVGETATFDLRQLRDEQQPDRTGKTLPLTLDRGQFHWSIVATHGDPHIIGRAEVVSRSGRVASSYSCPVCCPDSGPIGQFDPNAYGLSVDGFVYTNAHGDYYDCYFNYYQGSFSFTSMLTYNTNIATVDGGGQLNGIAVGNTDVEGDYDYVEFSNDGMDCYRYYGNGNATAPVDVRPTVVISGPDVVPLAGTAGISTPVSSIQLIGTGNPPGGTFGWSTSSPHVSLSNTSSDTVTVTSVSESSGPNDVAIVLIYAVNGQGNSATKQITVQKPTTWSFVNILPGSDHANTCSNNPVTGLPRAGWFKSITWQLLDKWGQPIRNLPTYDTVTADSQNSCDLDLHGTAPGQATDADGIWIHDYSMCTSLCVNQTCETDATQSYFANGWEFDLFVIFKCNGITVNGH